MKKLLLIALMAVPTTAMAVEDAERYEAYKQRRAERRAYALEARRQYNASKGPHVYRTAIPATAPITPFIAIEKGWVAQPVIPVAPIVTVGIPRRYHYADYVYDNECPSDRLKLAARTSLK